MAGIPEWRAKWLHHIPASQVATPNDGDRDVMEDARADCSAVRGVTQLFGSRRRQPFKRVQPKTEDGAVAAWRRGEPSAESRPPRIPTTEQSAAPVCVLQGESSVI